MHWLLVIIRMRNKTQLYVIGGRFAGIAVSVHSVSMHMLHVQVRKEILTAPFSNLSIKIPQRFFYYSRTRKSSLCEKRLEKRRQNVCIACQVRSGTCRAEAGRCQRWHESSQSTTRIIIHRNIVAMIWWWIDTCSLPSQMVIRKEYWNLLAGATEEKKIFKYCECSALLCSFILGSEDCKCASERWVLFFLGFQRDRTMHEVKLYKKTLQRNFLVARTCNFLEFIIWRFCSLCFSRTKIGNLRR